MKKLFVMSFLIVGALMVIPVVANAQAIVIKDTACTVLGIDPYQTFDVYSSVKIITPSRLYNKNVSCHGDLPEGTDSPASAIVHDFDSTGLACCVNFDGNWYSTNKWHETITPSGNVSLTCHFKGDEQADGCGAAN